MRLADRIEQAPGGVRHAGVVRWRDGRRSELDDDLVDEVPVALEFNGISHAVMLASPLDLEDFALGFALAEGIVDNAADVYGCEAVPCAAGITLQVEISSRCLVRLKERRRLLVGRTGCGLCGTESLAQLRHVPPVVGPEAAGPVLRAADISRAVQALRAGQILCQATGAMHAAAWCSADGRVELLREDVGRHNALDKLIGAAAGQAARPGGFIAITSRASVEMVHKACVAGARLLAAVSAPTHLAVETARAAGLCLVGLVRGDDLVIYTHPQRVLLDEATGAPH